jgi:hypothetical protein
MNLKKPSASGGATPLVFALVVAIFLSIYAFLQDNEKNNVSPSISIESQVMAMPECAFRSNLMTVLGAHYGDSSEELNEILQMYSKMKIQEMSKNNSL